MICLFCGLNYPNYIVYSTVRNCPQIYLVFHEETGIFVHRAAILMYL